MNILFIQERRTDEGAIEGWRRPSLRNPLIAFFGVVHLHRRGDDDGDNMQMECMRVYIYALRC